MQHELRIVPSGAGGAIRYCPCGWEEYGAASFIQYQLPYMDDPEPPYYPRRHFEATGKAFGEEVGT